MAEPEVAVEGDQKKIPNAPQTVIESKEETMEIDQYIPQDYTISASELMRDEKRMRKEEMNNENKQGITARYQPSVPDSLELLDKQPRMAGGTVAEENSYSQQQINIFHDHSYCINPLESFPIKRPSTRERNNLQPRMADGTVALENTYSQQQMNIFYDHSYCINLFDPSRIFQKKRQVKQSDTDMKCPKCEYFTRSALAWVVHLTNKHSTTPDQSGFALLCECGIVSQSSGHNRICEIANFTVIKFQCKSPMIPMKSPMKATTKCILCDAYPATLSGYTAHLRKHHATTMKANGVFIICSCGDELHSERSVKVHRRKCDSRQFQLYKQIFEECQYSTVESNDESAENKISEGSQSSIVERKEESAETSNQSEDSLADQHLFRTDNEESFTEDKVYKDETEEQAPKQFSLDFPHHDDHLVSESNEYSDHVHSGHSNEKTGHESQMRRESTWKSPSGAIFPSILVKKSPYPKYSDTEMGCPECEYRTKSATAWQTHLKTNHHTNPTLAGFALLCECGIESFSERHSRNCEISNFTVIRKRDGPIKRLYDDKATPKCLLCEKYPTTGSGYLSHLFAYHKTTLMANGIYLTCACGFKITCDSRPLRDHNKTCRGSGFTLHRIEEK